MTVKMIVAVDRGNAIGWEGGELPWKIPADMRQFKEKTTGKTVMMGRKTFESLGRPGGLPNRTNIVVTSNPIPGVLTTHHFRDFIIAHQQVLGDIEVPELWIIGGATIYQQAIDLELVDEIHLTLVDEHSGADVQLGFDLCAWKLFVVRQGKIGVQWNLAQISEPQKTADGTSFTFLTLKKTK